jgi:hypothetical protein
MKLLRQIRSSAATTAGLPSEPAPTVDSPRVVGCDGDPAVTQLVECAKRGQWDRIEAVLKAAPAQEARDLLISGVTREIIGRPSWIDSVSRHGDYVALLFRGAHAVAWAWQARGHLRASRTTKAQFDLFRHRLEIARADLEQAATLAPPGDGGAWVFQLDMARGLQYDKARLLGLFEESQRRAPWHPIAVSSMIQGLAPKWSGTLAEMFDVARSAQAAPTGSSAHVAMVEAHFEAALQTVPELYWRGSGVREDILAAAERSVDSPAYARTPRSLRDHNYFLHAYWQLREHDRWARELGIVQGHLTPPFTTFEDPVASYKLMRKQMSGPRS